MKLTMTNKPPEKVFYGVAPSPVGSLLVGLTDKNQLCRAAFAKGRKHGAILAQWRREWPHTLFIAGGKTPMSAKQSALLVGTPFQQSVWRLIAKIPSGSVTTYGAIAASLGKPKAARAVGGACGKNPAPYYIPCHRVIAGHGSLGGFSGGLGIKEKLLKTEGWL